MTAISRMKRKQSNSGLGFSLIEVMIVIVIIVGMLAMSVGNLKKRPENDIKSLLRKVSAGIRLSRDRARLNNKTYRIAVDLSNQTISFQVADQAGLVDTTKEIEEANQAAKEKAKSNGAKSSSTKEDESPVGLSYSNDTKIIPKGSLVLGDNAKIIQVEIMNVKDPIREGLAFIHISPEGFVEASTIQFQNKIKNIFTLVINPITGQSEIVEREIALKDTIEK